jgi:hypothetical protein
MVPLSDIIASSHKETASQTAAPLPAHANTRPASGGRYPHEITKQHKESRFETSNNKD